MDHQYRENGARNIYSSYNQMRAYVECSPNQSKNLYLIDLSIEQSTKFGDSGKSASHLCVWILPEYCSSAPPAHAYRWLSLLYTCLSIFLATFKTSPWQVCPNTSFSRTACSLSRYNVKGELDCFNCKTGVFLRLFASMFIKESNYIHVFAKKLTLQWGMFNNYKEKLSVPRVHTAALQGQQHNHDASFQLNIGAQ